MFQSGVVFVSPCMDIDAPGLDTVFIAPCRCRRVCFCVTL